MGSKFSRMRRRDVKAAASVVPAASHSDMDPTNEGRPRQDAVSQPHALDLEIPKVPVPVFRDDSNVATSTTSTENNSARARSTSFDTANNMSNAQHLFSTFQQFLEEQRLRGIVYDTQPSAPPVAQPQPVEPVQSPPTTEPSCLTCCKNVPREQDPNYSKEAVRPCRICKHDYCAECIRNVFTDACKDLSRMPPRCCGPINLHVARPYLTEEEAQLFRQKYEEWSTRNPFYCPVPVCSAFIPERLQPQSARMKDKQRVDSGVGTPTAATFGCPSCEASICIECRQVAHPGSICSITEFGLDVETAALLKSWGYKKCPKCGHGVKRMFGCNHMECRCGSHFCWSCLESIETCEGGCVDDEDEDDEEEDESDNEEERAPTVTVEAQATDVDVGGSATTAPVGATPTRENPRPRNLDGGGAHYWANTDLDFGEEPAETQDRAWDCRHYFDVYKIPFATALGSQTTDMECVKCWSIIHPEIESPKPAGAENGKPEQARTARGGLVRGRGGIRGRGRGGRARYQPPRGLFRADATIGTAPHLTANISPSTQSLPAHQTSPMEDVQFSNRIAATPGNASTTQMLHQAPRLAPTDTTLKDIAAGSRDISTHESAGPATPTSTIFNTPSTPFSLAHECHNCQMLVCNTCKSHATAAQEEKDRLAELAAQQVIDRQAREREEIDALPLTLPLPEPEPEMAVRENAGGHETQSGINVEQLEMATPSIFD